MTPPAGDARVDAAVRLLRERGLPTARVRAAGREGEIAAIEAPAAHAPALAALAPELRALGFRYVALDLTAAGASG